MAVDFLLPDLGEGIHEAEIVSVKVKEGDSVEEDQPLFEVETDKAVVEIPSPYRGVIAKIHVKEGETVKTGCVMVSFELAGATSLAAASSKEAAKGASSSKAQESTRETGSPRPTDSATTSGARAGGNGRSGGAGHDPNRPVPAAPAVRRLARELGIDLYTVAGSGPAGRVLKEDVRAYAAGTLSRMASTSALEDGGTASQKEREQPAVSLLEKYGGGSGTALDTAPPSPTRDLVELPDFEKYGKVEKVALRSIRRKIAMNMTQSWTHIPHVTHFDEADVSDLSRLIEKREKQRETRGVRLTMTAFAVKAAARALARYPQFNSSLDEARGEIVFKHYFNIGVAVATERGLIVPVIRDADEKSLVQIAADLSDIAEKTRSGKIELDRLQGGTFTITNIGAIGGTSMVPMINYPEAAILGMARAQARPVARGGAIEIATILPLALSFDHRLADGAEAAYFVRHIVGLLEDPLSWLLD
jgi:pyruvate dehydrogenase E2 component (dihydrolipoamide acetyltransferase)